MSDFLTDPPEDDMETLAAEYALGLLSVAQLPHVVALRQGSLRFDQAVRQWELRLLPLAELLDPVTPPPHVWTAISKAITPRRIKGSTWDSLRFWRGFSLAAGAACAIMVGALLLQNKPASPVPVATAMLASKSDGIFVATAEQAQAGMRLVVSPSGVSVPAGKAAELWLITPGNKPAPLGLLAGDRPVTVSVPAAQLGDIRLAELAVSIEPPGGSPTGQPTGPVIAAAKFSPL